jgi:pimeloyl-ACP methyl ester carboxylesterase
MSEQVGGPPETVIVQAGPVAIGETRVGAGPSLVYLHGEDGLLFAGDLLSALGEQFSVRAPQHPRWAPGIPCPRYLSTIDDLSYVYLDYLESVLDAPAVVVGTSIGAWLAAAVATKSTTMISALVLVSPVGIKVSDRETRDFVDIYAAKRQEVDLANYGGGPRPDLLALEQDDFLTLALAQEAVSRYTFDPYLYDPKLIHRLRRIEVPTLILWGADDGLALDPGGYAAAYAEAIGDNAATLALDGAHRLDEQRPREIADAVGSFLAGTLPTLAGASA